ncbi:MAG: hypothetical protein KC503_29535, partial [Myxococcales bacterium]|nr:hypothetical protein [Myxococcales bacterium]
MRSTWIAVAMLLTLSSGSGCSDSGASGLDSSADARGDADGGASDTRSDQADGPSGPHWSEAHCKTRTCYFVMKSVAGADDAACNGRHPADLGSTDADGKRDCPFASLDAVRGILNPASGAGARGVTVFVGAGTYALYPSGLAIRGDGTSADEAVIVTAYDGQKPIIDGTCPATCTVQTPSGPVTRDPCCQRACPSCSTDARCKPVQGSATQCAVPIDHVEQLVTISGSWVRVEGLDLRGCWEDNIRVAWRDTGGAQPTIIPNEHIYIANNRIEGCEVNENIKGLRNGPGPAHGGPAWGPVHVVGNELYAMASQAVDATGVHNWTVEDNYAHDAKTGQAPFTDYDGGGIGFKNGSSDVRVRNNWSERSDGYGGGGSSGSCIGDTTPPADWGCFQKYEMIDALFENNVALDASLRAALNVFHCDGCRFYGNYVVGGGEVPALLLIGDVCPGPRCEAHNPGLLPTRDLR